VPRSLRAVHRDHQARSRPSGFGFAFADRISYLDAGTWDTLTRDSTIYLSRGVLGAIEAHGPENVSPPYAMIFRADEPVAAMATQLVTITPARLGHTGKLDAHRATRLLKRALTPMARRTESRLRGRMLVGGNLLSWGFHGVAFAPAVDPASVWAGVAEALYRIRRAERLAGQTNIVMVKDATDAHPHIDELRRYSYRPVETEPNMVLEIPPAWRSYDDYLNALDAKRRSSVRSIGKKLAAAGCTVERLSSLDADANRLHELYLSVHERASIRLVTLPPAFLPALARAAGDAFRCTVIRRAGAIVGFVTSVRDGDTAVAYYVGFDRAEAESGLPLYLRLLHAPIADAIDWRCARLSLGRTALEPKAGLGARPEPMAIWLRHRVPAINWMLRGVLGAVPHAEAPERNPFKSTTSS